MRSRVRPLVGVALLPAIGCDGQQPAEDPVATPIEPDAQDEGEPGHLTCEPGQFHEPLELAKLEDGWSVSEGYVVDGCTTAEQIGWRLVVDGEPVIDGTVEVTETPSEVSFALDFDTDLAGAAALLEIAADGEPAVDVALELVGLVDPEQE